MGRLGFKLAGTMSLQKDDRNDNYECIKVYTTSTVLLFSMQYPLVVIHDHCRPLLSTNEFKI